ncbi:MAG TPA: acyl-CoA dehydrogenase family protein, partial [Gammaproteobacteria bacterium]|nr:acyl-CoA dehydrogenase family protein [Gammaproteobacteria bacterium]
METWFWLLVVLATAVTLAYRRVDLKTSTAALGVALVAYTWLSDDLVWPVVLWLLFVPLALLNVESLRRNYVTRPLLGVFRQMLPPLSRTEKDALEAGTVWWEGQLFSGMPDWNVLRDLPAPKLTGEEQAFLDGATEELCCMLDDWAVTHELADMPPEVWAFIKKHRFFAMIIPKEYGGLGFSPLANSNVLTKIAS